MDVTRETTVGELLDKAKFKPGDVVTHKACPPRVATKMVVLCGYIPFTAEQAVGERGYFVRVSEHGSRPDAIWFNLEKFAEWVEPIRPRTAPNGEAAQRLRDYVNGLPKPQADASPNPATATSACTWRATRRP